MTLLRLHLALVVVATSYLTLGLFSHQDAQDWCLHYAVVTLVIAAVTLKKELKIRALTRTEN